MIKAKDHLTSSQIRELAREAENSDGAIFYVQNMYYDVYSCEEGYMVDIYDSEEDLLDDNADTIDGGLCTGCSVDAIEFMLPSLVDSEEK